MTRFYLLLSAAGLFVIALSYGLFPTEVLPRVLDVTIEGRDLNHIFRTIMGLYLGMVILWVLGAFWTSLTRTAVIAEVTFLTGLAFGRVVSIVIDGIPSILLVIYAVLKIAMGLWCVLILKRPVRTQLET